MFRRSFIAILFFPVFALHAQESGLFLSNSRRFLSTISLSFSDTSYALPQTFVLQGSEVVRLDSIRLLRPGVDYQMDYFRGMILFPRHQVSSFFTDSAFHSIHISYEVLPFSLKRAYSLHQVLVRKDSSGGISRKVQSALSGFSIDDVFGSSLQKSGSIFRGLTVGSNRDLTLNSGFRMQLAGRLSSDLDIVAALTDENVPIQPEGTTQSLQELDRVFIQLKNPRYGATLGDFVYDIDERDAGEFGRLSRKLQGANGQAVIRDALGQGSSLSIGLAGGTARGKFTTNQFQGIEGTQGPYRLTGQDVSRRPIIIAGTERVYVDGQLMTRGETNDYTIDYSTGEISFSAKRLVTNATRINVDFEYADRQYTRNLVGVSAGASLLDNRLQIHTAFTQEADDPDSPIDIALSDSLRNIIAGSGIDRFKASINGLSFAGTDSVTLAGRGQYILKDTLINGRSRAVIVYAPGDPGAYYSAVFSLVDQMPPDSLGYTRLPSGGFIMAGLGKGNYLPVQYLPIPELHRVMNGMVSFAARPDLTVHADYALSSYDRNRLSEADNQSNQGGAYKIGVEYHPKNLRLGTTSLGDLDLRISDRFVDHRFTPLDRANDIEFNRNWNLSNLSVGDEEIRQASLAYMPMRSITVGVGYGWLERKGSVQSSRATFNAAVVDSTLPKMGFSSEYIQTDDLLSSTQSSWTRQKGAVRYDVWKIGSGLRVEMEDRQDRPNSIDSLSQGSFRFLEIAPRLSLINLEPLRAGAEIQIRSEDSAYAGTLQRSFHALTQLYDLQLREWRSFSTSLSLALRKTDLSDESAGRGALAANTMLVRSQMRYAPWQRSVDADVLYEFSRERSAAMKRVFIRVPKGTGNYTYLGDINHNGLADDNEFEQARFDGEYISIYVPSDDFVPVVDLRTGLRLRLTPARSLTQPQTMFEKAVAAFSTETVARIEEKSSESDASRIYLLHLSKFLNDSTTITGTNLFTQDVYLFEADPSFSLRFRYNQRKGLLRLVGSTERTALRERGIRMRLQLVKEIGNQTEFTNKTDRLFSSIDSPRERDLSSNTLKTEFSYRPYPDWEVAFGGGASAITNKFGASNATAYLDDQFLNLTYSILSLGQLRGELQREDVRIATDAKGEQPVYPYEMTNGGVVGKTLLWRLAFDYRISQYIQVSVNYDGRSEGGRRAVHTARAEARAFF